DHQAGQEQLVVDDTVLHVGRVRPAGQVEGAVEAGGRRLLGVDVLARGDRLPQGLLARGGHLGVEVDVHAVVGEDGVQVGGDVVQAVAFGQRPQRGLAAADE